MSNGSKPIGALAMTVIAALVAITARPAPADNYLDSAKDAACWIRSTSIQTARGPAWPAEPGNDKTVATSLYSGVPGVVLFFLEAATATGDDSYLKDARQGADFLLSSLAEEKGNGLYTGLAGIGFVLQETFKKTGDRRYKEGALKCVATLHERASKEGKGVQWDDTTDIISGSAGIGLFLLYSAREMRRPQDRDLAAAAARRLIEVGRQEQTGVKWAMDPKYPRLMPNFSHGTAGIAYFLASVYAETKEPEFLDAAIAGARYLQSVAETEGDVCLVFHNEPDGKDLYYLGWCHGPAGTARLFFKLYKVTGDRGWLKWVERSAKGIMQSGIPEKQTPGFWNNVSQCCGSAGVAEFFLSLHRVTGDRTYLAFAKRVTAQLLSKSTREANGLKWIQAEHRVRPELLVAQTGYMQGAAGIGMLLLHLDGFQRGKKPSIVLPDSPF
jgi:lantibiotic modifying enzyme